MPGDPSSAAFFTALTLLNQESSLKIKDVGLNPTRIGFYQILKKQGAKIQFLNKKIKNNELRGDILVKSHPLKPIRASRKYYVNSTDEYPILFVLAALSKGVSTFSGIGDLANKESNRITEMQKILKQLNIKSSSSKNELKIFGKGMINASNKKILVPDLGDHRICMSSFILAILTGAKTKIKNFETVYTSSPSFLKIMKSLGAKFEIQKNRFIQVSCDGGAATGKSTGAKMISKKYNLRFLSSGLLYRYAAYLILKFNPKNKFKFLSTKFNNLDYKKINKINLHSPEISKYSAYIAKNNKIRTILKIYQTKFSKKYKNCCIEGRDISTKILPNSDVKFFFKCDLKTASYRRFKELKKIDAEIKLIDVKKALRIRNTSDTKRKNSPLLKHRDSIEIDTGKLNKSAMIKKMSKYIEIEFKKKYAN